MDKASGSAPGRAEACGVRAIGMFCGSSTGGDPAYLALAEAFGRTTAASGLRLVYGGGGVGLMGAAARAAHEAGGDVLGVIPEFLQLQEVVYDAVRTVVVPDLHARKKIMADESDGFVILPGGIGTLEEVVEILSWGRLDLHDKLTVFLDDDGYWDAFFAMIEHQIDRGFTPPEIMELIDRAHSPEEALAKFTVPAAG
jgi:uncharacterized protein (TIGR00730 family)